MISLAAGKVDVVTASPGISAAAYADGENVSVGLAINRASNLMLIAKPGYTDLESLRGKKLGVMGTNSDSYRITSSYMEDAGIVLGEDVEVVEIKNPANLLAGFKTDQLEAVVLMSQFALDAVGSGGIVLMNIDEAGKEVFGRSSYSSVMLLGDHFWGMGSSRRGF
jgi:ABC-type nitrate/sulfonate/bicarbonate transport system substrate-binding protein